jgi:hypothetical protein
VRAARGHAPVVGQPAHRGRGCGRQLTGSGGSRRAGGRHRFFTTPLRPSSATRWATSAACGPTSRVRAGARFHASRASTAGSRTSSRLRADP